MPDEAFIGIDIGGTNIKAGLVTQDGNVSQLVIRPTNAGEGRDALLRTLKDLISAMRRQAEEDNLKIRGVGIGTAGYVNRDGIIITATDNLPGWQGTPVKARLEAACGLPVAVMNDAHAMALGEAWIGSSPSRDHFLCVSLGTGIGGAIIENGLLYGGRDGYAGGFGHHVIRRDGLPCNCGRRGCWEQYGSVSALIRMAREVYESTETSFLSPQWLFEEARRGSPQADGLIREYASLVGEGIVNLLHLFNPPAVMVGGAVTAQGEALFNLIIEYVEKYTLANFWNPAVPVMPIRLGEKAAIAGAAKGVMPF